MRRRNVAGGRDRAHKVRVTEEESAELARLAEQQEVTVARLLVESALAGGGGLSAERRAAVIELFKVQRLLANLANNTNQIARTANTVAVALGEGSVEEELVADLRRAAARAPAVFEAVRAAVVRVGSVVDELGEG